VGTDSPGNVSPRTMLQVQRWFALAAGLIVLWMIGLGLLSYWTANPVTLNRDQVLEATDVLTAVVEDVALGRVGVEKSWKNAVRNEQLTLSNLRETKPVSRQRLIIPVTLTSRGWQITPSKLPRKPPFIYPATAESERQLRHLLKTGRLP